MATPFHVELTTPERVVFSGDAEAVSLRTDAGEIAFLARHEDFIGAVDITVAKIDVVANASGEGEPTEVLVAAVHGGFVHVDADGVRILAAVAEIGSEIDVDRARAALAAAESAATTEERSADHRVHGNDGDAGLAKSPAMIALLEPESPEARARRARVRLEAAGVATSA